MIDKLECVRMVWVWEYNNTNFLIFERILIIANQIYDSGRCVVTFFKGMLSFG